MRGDGRIFLRGGIWQIAYYVDGRERRESAKSADRKVADRLLRKRLRERAAHQETGRPFVGPEQKRVRVSELLDALEKDCELRGLAALDKLRSHLRSIRETFGDWRAVNVNPQAIDTYVSDCLEQGVQPATINRRMQPLGQAFRLAVERGVLATAPRTRRLSEAGNARRGFFEHGDLEVVLANLPPYLQDFTRFAYLTGWRKSEVASLIWADVDRKGRVIRLRPEASKNRQGRIVVLEGELWEIIERRWPAREVKAPEGETLLARYVFHLEGRPVGDFRKAWLSATKEAGMKGKLFHDLRRSFVRNAVRAGVPERVVMEVSGHRTRHVFDRYNIVSEADLRAAMRKTQDYLAAESKRSVVPFEKAQEEQR
jgi:integrase